MDHYVLLAGHTPAEPIDLAGLDLIVISPNVEVTFGVTKVRFLSHRFARWFHSVTHGRVDSTLHFFQPRDWLNTIDQFRHEREGRRFSIVENSDIKDYMGFRKVRMTSVLQHLSVLTGAGYFVKNSEVMAGMPFVHTKEGYHESVRLALSGGLKMSGGMKITRKTKL